MLLAESTECTVITDNSLSFLHDSCSVVSDLLLYMYSIYDLTDRELTRTAVRQTTPLMLICFSVSP
jgi:hypothetical protein